MASPSFNAHTSPVGVGRQPKRPSTRDGEKEAIWVPMLQSASKGKDLAEKQLIVLGGSPDQQREFLEQLSPKDNQNRANDRRRANPKSIPVSNKYALGYTYHDVLDADQEDVLARMNVYMLTNPSGAFAPLLKPLLTVKTVKETLVVVLLDWADPFRWARQLRQWVRLLRKVIMSLDDETKIELEECMNAWKEKRVGPDATSTLPEQSAAPLGPGEWEDGLGIPLNVVCVQREKIERLEKELGWQDDQFDFLQQWLRTVLLKHGASLVYTASFDSNDVRPLIHSSLSIHSLLKKEVVKHNVIDRDKILVPPNWDSWAKIRILREGFDPESTGNAWSVEIQDAPEDNPDFDVKAVEADPQAILDASQQQQAASAVSLFESSLIDPNAGSTTQSNKDTSNKTVTTVTPLQEFLQSQSVVLEKLLEEDRQSAAKSKRPGYLEGLPTLDSSMKDDAKGAQRAVSPAKGPLSARLAENIGPYQINVNGIDFDAEEATRRLRERENERNAAKTNSTSARDASTSTPNRSSRAETPGADGKEKPSNEALHGFFANLIKKGQGGAGSRGGSVNSGPVSPRITSPAPEKMDRGQTKSGDA